MPKNLQKHKYGARQTCIDGHKFASALEASLYGHLKILESAKEISQIQLQPNVQLSICCCCNLKRRMIPDFKVFDEKLNQPVYYEAKGVETDRWLDNVKLWKVHGPGRLLVFKGTYRRLFLSEEIIPKFSAAGLA